MGILHIHIGKNAIILVKAERDILLKSELLCKLYLALEHLDILKAVEAQIIRHSWLHMSPEKRGGA